MFDAIFDAQVLACDDHTQQIHSGAFTYALSKPGGAVDGLELALGLF